MRPNLLILGGTTEASALAQTVAAAGLSATLSLAGRVARPKLSPLPQRVGGFGGAAGLAAYLRDNGVTHLIDATHPFAAQMSHNAVTAAHAAGLPLAALTRPPWQPVAGDKWEVVPDMDAAVQALSGPPSRILLAIGRMYLAAFAAQPQHHYVLRLVDPPAQPLPLPQCHPIIARGPFTEAQDRRLMQDHRIARVVSKNSGGAGAYAKIAAARHLGLPVIMIDRPTVPARTEWTTPDQVLDWLHQTTLRGV